MAGFETQGPKKGGLGWVWAAAAGVAAVMALRSCGDAPPPVVPPAKTPIVESEPERVPYYLMVATSMGSIEIAHGNDRAAVERAALAGCEAQREARLSRGVYVSAKNCVIRQPIVSNYGGSSCAVVFKSTAEYDYEAPVLAASIVDYERPAREFMRLPESRMFNTRVFPSDASIIAHCVDYYGRPSTHDIGYTVSR